jgi:hypothetical protein
MAWGGALISVLVLEPVRCRVPRSPAGISGEESFCAPGL